MKIKLLNVFLVSVLSANITFASNSQVSGKDNKYSKGLPLVYSKTKPTPSNGSFGFSRLFVTSMKDKVVSFVHKTVDSINYNRYKLGGRRFDADKGIYVLDCSDYVDNILENVYPDAYMNLVDAAGTAKPTSLSYYNFFRRLSDSNDYWSKVDGVEGLEPGDILVFKNKKSLRSGAAGHVMIVMKKPVRSGSAYLVRVADAAPHRHSNDTREAQKSGIGIGTLLLKVHPSTGKPTAYAWQIGSRWKNNVWFAMGRPGEVSI